VYTRRDFLKVSAAGAVTVAAGGVLVSCGTGTGTASPKPSSGTVGGKFALFTWAGYDGKGVKAIDDWYASNKIALDVKYISNENMVNFLKSPGSESWDSSSVNQGDAEYLFAQGVSSEITVDEVPAFNDMYDFFKDGSFFKIRDGVYNSVPWTWGPIGINTRPDKVPADALTSWEGLFDAKWTGRIGTYDDPLNMISTACCATGKDPATLSKADLDGPVKDWLVRLKPQLKVLSTSIGDQINLLVSGDVDIELIGLTWFSAQAATQNATVDFRIPDEGTYGFVDSAFITPWAPDRANAIAWANAITTGDTALALLESVNQLGSVKTVTAKIKDEIFATYGTTKDAVPDAVSKLKWNKSWYDAGQYATIDEWRKVWEDVKALG
jgi:putative spermidine/putrescine transport system substrate-binding protein/spermidine/putrescine transport system substrate-binding protein